MTEKDTESVPSGGPEAVHRQIVAEFGEHVARALEQMKSQAAATGLNLFHAWSLRQLRVSEIDWVPLQSESAGSNGVLLLFGNAGPDFWRHLQQASEKPENDAGTDQSELAERMFNGDRGSHPVDSFAALQVKKILAHGLAGHKQGEAEFIYPATAEISASKDSSAAHHAPLQKLGQLAGWHQPSPLGTGIQPRWGLWYAYRALVWLPLLPALSDNDALDSIPVTKAGQVSGRESTKLDASICATCESKACVSACPGQALGYGSTPDMSACTEYRMQDGSSCADRCLAREACPVNTDQHYPREQISYHYRKALVSLQEYFGDGNPGKGDSN